MLKRSLCSTCPKERTLWSLSCLESLEMDTVAPILRSIYIISLSLSIYLYLSIYLSLTTVCIIRSRTQVKCKMAAFTFMMSIFTLFKCVI